MGKLKRDRLIDFRLYYLLPLLLFLVHGCATTASVKSQGNKKAAVFYYNQGNDFIKKRAYDRAIASYTKAIETNKKFTEAYSNRGYAFSSKRDCDRAISDFNTAVAIDPTYANAYSNRAICHFIKKQYDNAWDDVQKAEKLGRTIAPRFLIELQKASGRQR